MNKLRVNLTDIKNIYLSEISLKIMLLIEIYWILVSFFLIYDPIIYISNNYFIFNSKSINNYLLNSIWFIILLIIISTIIF